MKVVLCGGQGMRLQGFAGSLPKPMVPIGDRPPLWHIMSYYAYFGHCDFLVCVGHQADAILAATSSEHRTGGRSTSSTQGSIRASASASTPSAITSRTKRSSSPTTATRHRRPAADTDRPPRAQRRCEPAVGPAELHVQRHRRRRPRDRLPGHRPDRCLGQRRVLRLPRRGLRLPRAGEDLPPCSSG